MMRRKRRRRPSEDEENNSEGEEELIRSRDRKKQTLTCRWLLTSSLVRPSTFMSSLICFGVAAGNQNHHSHVTLIPNQHPDISL